MNKTIEQCNVVRAAKLIGLDKPCEVDGQCIGYSVGENEEPHEECKACKLFQSYEE